MSSSLDIAISHNSERDVWIAEDYWLEDSFMHNLIEKVAAKCGVVLLSLQHREIDHKRRLLKLTYAVRELAEEIEPEPEVRVYPGQDLPCVTVGGKLLDKRNPMPCRANVRICGNVSCTRLRDGPVTRSMTRKMGGNATERVLAFLYQKGLEKAIKVTQE
jgi:hypothetical protein